MSLSPRKRIVVFRLSEEEYKSLEAACDARGARNISEFTRSTILSALNEKAASEPPPGIERMQQEMINLRTAISDLKFILEDK